MEFLFHSKKSQQVTIDDSLIFCQRLKLDFSEVNLVLKSHRIYLVLTDKV